jgi:hypothetical protein
VGVLSRGESEVSRAGALKNSDCVLAAVSNARAPNVGDAHLARVAAHGLSRCKVAHLLSRRAGWLPRDDRASNLVHAAVANARAPNVGDAHLARVAAHGLSRCKVAHLLSRRAGWVSWYCLRARAYVCECVCVCGPDTMKEIHRNVRRHDMM